MQKTIPVFLLSLSLASCINVKSDNGSIGDIFTGKKGNGPMTEKTFSGDFNSIEVSTSIHADIVKSDVEKVVGANENLPITLNGAPSTTAEILITSIITDEGLLDPYGVGEINLQVKYQVL